MAASNLGNWVCKVILGDLRDFVADPSLNRIDWSPDSGSVNVDDV